MSIITVNFISKRRCNNGGQSLPFEVFNCHHSKRPAKKLVVTAVDALTRTLYELNAEPAAQEYARLLNLDVKDLCPTVFALHPLALKVGGQYYIRSIHKVNAADLNLTFTAPLISAFY